MRTKWLKIVSQIEEGNLKQIRCPNCGEYEIDYTYVGDCRTRIGFLQIWCDNCLKGVYISRALAPSNAKMVDFDTDLEKIIPKYDFFDE